MAVLGATAGRNVVAESSMVHGAGWQRAMEMGLGLLAAPIVNVLVLGLRTRTVERDRALLVGVVAAAAEGGRLEA